MKKYLVGGAVRDKLLGRNIKDTDYVITDSDPEELIHLGFLPVGKSHEVYLHPKTREEYTLANDIVDDLQRRDLTINSLAMEGEKIIDPFGGLSDLENRILRHVKEENFFEDPLRVYRLARFSAELPDFKIDRETISVVKRVTKENHLLSEIRPERIRNELEKVFLSRKPSNFFYFLKANNLLGIHFPELSELSEAQFDRTLEILDRVGGESKVVHYASLFIFLNAEAPVGISQRLLTSNEWLVAANAAQKFYLKFLGDLSPQEIVESFYGMDAFRNPNTVKVLMSLYMADGKDELAQSLFGYFNLISGIKSGDIRNELSGKELGHAIKMERIKALRKYLEK